MLECESGAVSRDGAEGQGGRGDAGLESDGIALAGFLSVLRGCCTQGGQSLRNEKLCRCSFMAF